MGWNCPECGQSEGEPSGYIERLEAEVAKYKAGFEDVSKVLVIVKEQRDLALQQKRDAEKDHREEMKDAYQQGLMANDEVPLY